LRSKILEAHIKASPEILREQIELVLDVRKAWHQVDKPNLGSGDATQDLVSSNRVEDLSMASAAGGEGVSMNWTA